MENKPIKKINSIAELVMMLGSKSNITDEEKREIRERIDELRAQRVPKATSLEKPISKMNNMSQLVMKLEKGDPTEAERLEIKQQLEKLRVKRAKKDKTDPTKVPKALSEPTLGEKTMMLRKYYAEKYGQKPVVNDPFKIINLEPESQSFRIDRGYSSSSCSSSINTEAESTSDCGILKQLEKDYDIIEIKISMRKK